MSFLFFFFLLYMGFGLVFIWHIPTRSRQKLFCIIIVEACICSVLLVFSLYVYRYEKVASDVQMFECGLRVCVQILDGSKTVMFSHRLMESDSSPSFTCCLRFDTRSTGSRLMAMQLWAFRSKSVIKLDPLPLSSPEGKSYFHNLYNYSQAILCIRYHGFI